MKPETQKVEFKTLRTDMEAINAIGRRKAAVARIF